MLNKYTGGGFHSICSALVEKLSAPERMWPSTMSKHLNSAESIFHSDPNSGDQNTPGPGQAFLWVMCDVGKEACTWLRNLNLGEELSQHDTQYVGSSWSESTNF